MKNYRVIETPDEWRLPCPASGSIDIPRDGRWSFDGNYEWPTFSPSVNETRGQAGQSCEDFKADPRPWRNHVFIRQGRIEYLSDCTHEFAGTTVEILPLSEAQVGMYYGDEALAAWRASR